MSKLLCAGFSRLKKDKFFWSGMLFMFLYPIISYISTYLNFKDSIYDYERHLENYFFNYTMFAGILAAVFCSMFIGTEYSDGAIRNKLIVGHSRIAVYLSNYIISVAAILFMCIDYMVTALLIGIPLFGFFKMGFSTILGFIGYSIMMVLAYAGIFTLLAMLNSNKSTNAVLSILLIIVMTFGASYISSRLAEPEMENIFSYSVSAFGEEGAEGIPDSGFEQRKNPYYLEGKKREVYEFMYDFLPPGQSMQFVQLTACETAWRWPLCSFAIAAVTTTAGVFLFRKKDLK